MKKRKLRFILSMTILLTLLLLRPIDFDQGHESIHKDLMPPKPGTYTEDNFVDGSVKVIETQDGDFITSPQLSLSQDDINELNDGDAEKVLVIPVQFIDEQFDLGHDKAHFESIMEEMRVYYELNSDYIPGSSGITIDYYVLDFMNLSTTMSYFGADGAGIDDLNGSVFELARQAVLKLDATDSSFDFSEYDTDGDNVIDHLIIIHAGIGQEEEPSNTDLIWSHQWSIGGTTDYTDGQEVDGVYAHNYTTVPENGKLGVFAHEFGHDLGLPDLYDTDGYVDGLSEGAGFWDLMASGSWNSLPGNDAGTLPSNLSAWSRAFLGWEVPNAISSNQLGSSLENTNGISSIIQVFPKGNSNYDQHYLVEYRRRIDNDAALPGEGVLVWYIDDWVIDGLIDGNWVNTYEYLPGVVFARADGTDNYGSIDYYGNSGDPFPGTTNNHNFTYMPYELNSEVDWQNNNSYYTYVDILDINTNGYSATFDIYVEENAPTKPTVISPLENEITSFMPTFTWNIVPQAQEYIIQVASDSSFTNIIIETSLDNIKADANGQCSYTLNQSLAHGNPLYWRVTATNATNLGDTSNYVWSDIYQFIPSLNNSLSTPNNLSVTEPILGELEITWDSVNGALNYLLEVDGEIVNQNGVSTTYNHTNLELSSTHTYRVMAISDINLSSWSAPYVLTTQNEATISLDCSGVVEGNENGSIIIVEISSLDGEFISSLTKDDINISGLPDGIAISSIDLNGTSTSVEITLSGNSTVDYDVDQLVSVSIEKEKFVPQQNQTLTTSDYIAAIDELKPDAPIGITFSMFGSNANKLMGTDTTMEFSIDGGNTYIDISTDNMLLTTQQLSNLSVENDILVRYKGNFRVSASDNTVIDLLSSTIRANFSTAVVEGSEDGSEIIIEIQDDNGRFVDGLTVNDISVSGLPAGISKNNITINSTTSLAISLSGNSIIDYDVDQEIIVSIAKDKFMPQQINELTDSAIIVAIDEPTPNAPNGITFTFNGVNANQLMGTDTSMEFSVDGGNTYIDVITNDIELTIQQLSTLSVENDILVRYKENLRVPASDDTVIDLLSSSISADFSTAVVEGLEDGSEIIIEIQDDNGRFVDGLTINDIIVSGLPAGISKNNITINSTTSVSISLSGNSSIDYDEDQEVIVSLAKDKFMPQQINELTDSTFLVATNEAPIGITFYFDGDNPNQLMGTDTSMEFSIDGGSTYVAIDGNNFEIAPEYLNALSADNGIYVRSEATSTTPASSDYIINLSANSEIPDVTRDDSANTITGMLPAMEFSSNNGSTWVKYVDESSLPDLSNNITILVRYYRFGTTVHSDSISLTFTKPAPPPVIIMPPPAPVPIVEGFEIPITVIGESSSEEQIIVTISSEDKDKPIVFTVDLLNQVNNVKKDIVIEKEDLSFTLPPGAIDSSLFEDVDAVFTIDMDQIPPQDVQDKLDKAEQNDGKGLFAINGLVFEFEAQVVTEDTSTPVTEFEKDVTITISLDNTSISDDDVDKLGIYWFNEATEEWEYMGGQYDSDTNTITFTTGHFSTYSIFRFEKSFMDIQNHWAINEIEQLASMRIIKGKSDDIFDPNATITRAEFTALIVRTLDLSVDDYTVETPLEDVINDKWYYVEIGIAYNAGLLPKKYSNGYGPNTPISREDMVIIMSNALQLKNGFITMNNTDIQSILEGYIDVDDLDSEAIKAVAIAVNEGLIQGRTLSTIVPEGNLMRSEAAVVIKRLLGIIE